MALRELKPGERVRVYKLRGHSLRSSFVDDTEVGVVVLQKGVVVTVAGVPNPLVPIQWEREVHRRQCVPLKSRRKAREWYLGEISQMIGVHDGDTAHLTDEIRIATTKRRLSGDIHVREVLPKKVKP